MIDTKTAPEKEESARLKLVPPTTGQAESEILTGPALEFLSALHEKFEPRRRELLAKRALRLRELHDGKLFDFLPETADVRKGNWRTASIPADLQDRRVEITGPVDRKMIINALNSGANVFMADLEDANSPTWRNVIDGQVNLRDAVRRTISFSNPDGKSYKLNNTSVTLFVRPRGWHLVEKHVLADGQPMSASLFDFGLYFLHNAEALISAGTGPYFYLPKMESHLEARLWNDVFVFAQDYLRIPQGTIRATVLIETIPGAFEMDEILFELKDHSAGLNCGRWDYIFSFIKKFSFRPDWILPDRSLVTMDRHFLKSYVELLISTCHRRGIHAMGGMAAQIPIKNDPEANDRATEKIRKDKQREVDAGHDGTWVAHPGSIGVAKEVFDKGMPQPNQIARQSQVSISQADLLKVPEGDITHAGVELNIDVGIHYLEAWLRGYGAVPIYNLMEDAATAEISRAQLWQWARYGVRTTDGKQLSPDSVSASVPDVLAKIRQQVGPANFDSGKYSTASDLFTKMIQAEQIPEFLTIPAYEHLD